MTFRRSIRILAHHKTAIKMYESGESTRTISESIGVSMTQVLNILKANGFDTSSKRRTGGYRVNDDFFKKWTDEMAYVLGFVLTDGNVSGNSLSISQSDPTILERIKDAMGGTMPIKSRKNGKGVLYTLLICRKGVVEDLAALGITSNKSTSVEFPPVPEKHLASFIRGVIDGDRWVQNRGYVMNITTASIIFATQISGIFEERGLNTRVEKQSGAYRVWVSGKQDVIELGEWLYDNESELLLERKKSRFFVNKKPPNQAAS